MEYQNTIIAVVSGIVAIAVAWGIIRSEVSLMKFSHAEHKAELDSMRREIGRDLVGKEHCKETHARAIKDQDEMKAELSKINSKLDTLLMRSSA